MRGVSGSLAFREFSSQILLSISTGEAWTFLGPSALRNWSRDDLHISKILNLSVLIYTGTYGNKTGTASIALIYYLNRDTKTSPALKLNPSPSLQNVRIKLNLFYPQYWDLFHNIKLDQRHQQNGLSRTE